MVDSAMLLTRSPLALLVIAGSHFLIDRYRLARFLVYAKNLIAPGPRLAWSDAKGTGYPSETPPWLAVWLLIIADNLIHVLLNAAALRWL